LLFTALPFAEDIRQFTFALLPSTSKQEPTGRPDSSLDRKEYTVVKYMIDSFPLIDEQMEAVDGFIDSLILSKKQRFGVQ
jgi:hypothetical protein